MPGFLLGVYHYLRRAETWRYNIGSADGTTKTY